MAEKHPSTVARAAVPANRRRGGDIRVLLSPRTVGATAGFMGSLTLAPGEYISEHYHPYSEEYLYVVAGVLTMTIDGHTVEVGPDHAVLVPIGARHRAENRGGALVRAVYHLGPLAPRPDLGHVDTEEPPHRAESQIVVGDQA
ncbi:cupin domain-containing protein [Micromonospora fiedleri]|uniref:Cupin domain-containing protein n=1 Tax=Micromonospora fiedleri TaxID=1157498 RepID=A0ABS1UTZ7_9ACTN|nr:cupin domain-containing protein [Micromonospora fiedleri]MBL6279294.1 cupin domain-containing protein [Micromonospora fiedleri]